MSIVERMIDRGSSGRREGIFMMRLWLTVVAVAGLSVPAAQADWVEGDFRGALNWQGAVTQQQNPWRWAQATVALDGNLSAAQQEDNALVWHGLLEQGPLLLGKTLTTMPAGRPGRIPVVLFDVLPSGGELTWLGDGLVKVTLPATHEQAVVGSFSFTLRVGAALSAVIAGESVVANLYSEGGAGNGLPGRQHMLPAGQWWGAMQRMMGPEYAPPWLQGEAATPPRTLPIQVLGDTLSRQVNAVYAAEIQAGSGTLSFLQGQVPARWQAVLPMRVSYD